MIKKAFDSIEKSDIDSLIINEVSEDKTLEYKGSLPGQSDKEKKEFLTDVSAFANTSGGDILYGITAKKDDCGQPTELPEIALGIESSNFDKIRLRIESLIRDCINPKVPGIQIRFIEGFPNGPVIVLRIPKSWNSPHMITFKNWTKFYSRNSAGNYQLDVQEIRSAFLLSESFIEKVKRFRVDRIANIIAEETPISLKSGSKVVLHFLPISAFESRANIDFSLIKNLHDKIPRLYKHGGNHMFNFYGFLFYSDVGNQQSNDSYTQLFRNGIVEVVDVAMLEGKKAIPGNVFERTIIEPIKTCIELMKSLELSTPIIIMLSFIDVKGYEMAVSKTSRISLYKHPINEEHLILPELIIENYNLDIRKKMKPIFDIIWQSCGIKRSINFDDQGNWIGKE